MDSPVVIIEIGDEVIVAKDCRPEFVGHKGIVVGCTPTPNAACPYLVEIDVPDKDKRWYAAKELVVNARIPVGVE